MMKQTTAILLDGERVTFNADTVTCPCCINGAMTLKEQTEENLVFECVKCRATLTVPYVSLNEE